MLSRLMREFEIMIRRISGGLLVSLVFAAGCGSGGPELVAVTGKVTFQGKPVAGANITFIPANGSIATATTDANGAYTISSGESTGVVAGMAAVTVSKMERGAGGGMTQNMSPEDMQKMAMSGQMTQALAAAKSAIPEKYGNAATSGLKFDVTAGKENEFNIDLQ